MKSLLKPLQRGCALSAFAMVLTVAPHAHAAVGQGAATISDLRYTLTDLDPNDGISPSLQPYYVLGKIWGQLNFSALDVYEESQYLPPSIPGRSISGSWENGNDAISSSVGGGGRVEDVVLSVSHRSEAIATEAHASIDFTFYLTPATRITFYSDYALSSSGYEPVSQPRSITTFEGRLYESGSGEVQRFYRSAGDESLELNGTASLTWDNVSSEGRDGRLYLHAFGHSIGSAVPVPEPSSYAMLATGLGLMGLLARQRTRRARQSGSD
ncbi:PEP-CTERM sorting domain-containing protein [Pseudoduganella umbonata]|nr:PEP-CTERM sorting domain-containing protein [Pseudoduganella umbonata]MBB3223310.1 hypothetical protein [Pseudoduganella umbonata]